MASGWGLLAGDLLWQENEPLCCAMGKLVYRRKHLVLTTMDGVWQFLEGNIYCLEVG